MPELTPAVGLSEAVDVVLFSTMTEAQLMTLLFGEDGIPTTVERAQG